MTTEQLALPLERSRIDEAIAKLAELTNLRPNYAKVYVKLLMMKESSAGLLAKKAQCRRGLCYLALGSLESMGFVARKNDFGKIRSYVAVGPEEVIAKLKEKQRQEMERLPSLQSLLQNLEGSERSNSNPISCRTLLHDDIYLDHRGKAWKKRVRWKRVPGEDLKADNLN
jgi:sugar-specific transcriptional regulator TrmB